MVDNIEQIAREASNNMVNTAWLANFWAKGSWNSEIKQSAIELMSHIFAIWTLPNSQYYFELGGSSGRSDSSCNGGEGRDRSYLNKVGVAQVQLSRIKEFLHLGNFFQTILFC